MTGDPSIWRWLEEEYVAHEVGEDVKEVFKQEKKKYIPKKRLGDKEISKYDEFEDYELEDWLLKTGKEGLEREEGGVVIEEMAKKGMGVRAVGKLDKEVPLFPFVLGVGGGNESFFLNHSHDPNCRLVMGCKWEYTGAIPWVVTSKDVLEGEELTLSYAELKLGKDIDEDLCYCDFFFCPRFLSPPPTTIKEYRKYSGYVLSSRKDGEEEEEGKKKGHSVGRGGVGESGGRWMKEVLREESTPMDVHMFNCTEGVENLEKLFPVQIGHYYYLDGPVILKKAESFFDTMDKQKKREGGRFLNHLRTWLERSPLPIARVAGILRNQRGTLAALQPALRSTEINSKIYPKKVNFSLFGKENIFLEELYLDRNGVFVVSSCSSFWLGPCFGVVGGEEEEALSVLRRKEVQDEFLFRTPMTTADVYSLRGVGDMKQPELHKDPEFLDPDKAGIVDDLDWICSRGVFTNRWSYFQKPAPPLSSSLPSLTSSPSPSPSPSRKKRKTRPSSSSPSLFSFSSSPPPNKIARKSKREEEKRARKKEEEKEKEKEEIEEEGEEEDVVVEEEEEEEEDDDGELPIIFEGGKGGNTPKSGGKGGKAKGKSGEEEQGLVFPRSPLFQLLQLQQQQQHQIEQLTKHTQRQQQQQVQQQPSLKDLEEENRLLREENNCLKGDIQNCCKIIQNCCKMMVEAQECLLGSLDKYE